MIDRAAAVLDDGVATGAFPCAVAEAGDATHPLWRHAAGRLTYEADSPIATQNTIFDLASLTKVLATTAIAMRLLESRMLDLASPVRAHIPAWTADDRRRVTLADLLEHASGLPAYAPLYKTVAGTSAFVEAICRQPLAYPPRSASVYSDLGFILLGGVLESAGGAPLDRQFTRVWSALLPGVAPPTFGVDPRARALVAPTEFDPWRGRLVQGEVHDENAHALGGVAPHAGLFGTAAAVGAFARVMLRLLRDEAGEDLAVSSATVHRFATRSTVPGSSRALGWDTMLPTSSCGGCFSAAAIGHTGFTGTSLWLDPVLDRYAVLLTNRVHPTRQNDRIQSIRPAFHDALLRGLAHPGLARG